MNQNRQFVYVRLMLIFFTLYLTNTMFARGNMTFFLLIPTIRNDLKIQGRIFYVLDHPFPGKKNILETIPRGACGFLNCMWLQVT